MVFSADTKSQTQSHTNIGNNIIVANGNAPPPTIPAHGSQSVFQRTRPYTCLPSMRSKNIGQGQGTIGILSNLGDTFIVATNADRHQRPVTSPSTWKTLQSQSNVRPIVKGVRPMHCVTHQIEKPADTEYVTSAKQAFGGRKDLKPAAIPQRCRTMHSSQIKFSNSNSTWQGGSKYFHDYRRKELIPGNKTQVSSLVNRINMVEGNGFRSSVNYPTWKPNYWTEYSRIHNTLGFMRGPGAARPPTEKTHYNIINGKETPYSNPRSYRLQGLVIT